MVMKGGFSSIIIILTICVWSCSPHKQAQRINIQAMESEMVLDLKNVSDTILTITEIPSSGSRIVKSVKVLYTKGDGSTGSFMNSNYHSYPDTLVLKSFHWDRFVNSKDSIQWQKAQPAFTATVIEKDTTWEEMKPLFPTRYLVYIYLPDKLIAWETNTFEMATNPSMIKTELINYLLERTGHGDKTPWELYGYPQKQKKYRP
ncbi:MAG: hypothetical protein CMI36_03755 [Owenweeksia sp.]|nr:hypothetical protein [Owenweeksia sp.]MBF98084.1 hypothetical protein [Owenweeksia sp.]HBF21888.1 hypothetical protein [Cryomorphaceae bacterium]|tara:strand:- start:97 stop:705 length:609 start_codon:yes stop_codon:yes gene_type:complete